VIPKSHKLVLQKDIIRTVRTRFRYFNNFCTIFISYHPKINSNFSNNSSKSSLSDSKSLVSPKLISPKQNSSKQVFPKARILITVSKKISKSAPIRNRIRRKINGVLFDKFSKIPYQFDYLIQVNSLDILYLSYSQLEQTVFNEILKGVDKIKNYSK